MGIKVAGFIRETRTLIYSVQLSPISHLASPRRAALSRFLARLILEHRDVTVGFLKVRPVSGEIPVLRLAVFPSALVCRNSRRVAVRENAVRIAQSAVNKSREF